MSHKSPEIKKVINYIDSSYQSVYRQTYEEGSLNQGRIDEWAYSLVAPVMTFSDLQYTTKSRHRPYSEIWANVQPHELLQLLQTNESNTPVLSVCKIEELKNRDKFRFLSLLGLLFGLQRFPSDNNHPTPLEKMGLKIAEEDNAEVYCMYGIIDPLRCKRNKIPLHKRQPETVVLGGLVVTPYSGPLKFEPRSKRKVYQISRVGIFSNFKNQGLGEKLLKFVLAKYDSSKSIFVLSAREGRENFYKRSGFEIWGDKYINNGLANQWMIKK